MTRLKRFRIKNAMLISNGIANLAGILAVYYLTSGPGYELTRDVFRIARSMDIVFVPLSFAFAMAMTLIYERPIRRFLNMTTRDGPPPEGLEAKARKRLLNEPFFLIALDMAIWLAAAALYPIIFWLIHAGKYVMIRSFFISFHTGLITTTAAFFAFEFILQRRVFPFFFPDGRIYAVSGIFRISIRARLIAMLLACNLIPFFSILTFLWQITRSGRDAQVILHELKAALVDQSFIFIAVGIWVTFLVSSNLTRPLQRIIQVLQKVSEGRFDEKVRVASNDEIGYAGDVINEMTEGLRERDFIKDTFGKYVTREIRDEILTGKVSLDGELKEVTVLFADLRDFTPMVEKTPPKEVVRIINTYFKEMDEAIRQHHGLVLQYIGDEIEAVFGHPIREPDHALAAVTAAMEMRERLDLLNRERGARGEEPVRHGIGIHTGEVLAGSVGSPDRLVYAMVGDTVNAASRIQGLNKQFGTDILISEATRALLPPGRIATQSLGVTSIRGKSDAVEIHQVL